MSESYFFQVSESELESELDRFKGRWRIRKSSRIFSCCGVGVGVGVVQVQESELDSGASVVLF